MTGTIRRLIHAKGYGFVEDEKGDERFLHAKDLKHTHEFLALREGDQIEFEPTVRPAKNAKRNGLGVTKVRKV